MKGTMTRLRRILATLAVLGTLLSACAGGGSSSTSPTPMPIPTPIPDPIPDPTPDPTPDPVPAPTTLGWSPPQFFTDNTPLIPERDLEYFEVYIKQEAQYKPEDLPVAIVSPRINTLYLADLSPPLSRGVSYYFFIRAVPVEGEVSDFSDVGTFFLP